MKSLTTVLVMMSLTLGAWAQDWSWASKDGAGFLAVNVSKVKGNVVTGGSSTVFPLVQLVVDGFKAEGYQGQLSVDNIGTGAGLKRFGAGEIDFANASRPIVPSERKAAEARGKGKVLEFKLAMDALVILVSRQNTFAKEMDEDQIRAAFATADYWSDVVSTWPHEKINRYIPETSHGTFDFFQEHFWDDKGTMLKTADRTQRFQDYNQLIATVEKDKYGIGFLGFSYFKESDDTRAISFDGVLPNKTTVESQTYGLARYLYTYVNVQTLTTKPQASAYLAFLLNSTSRLAVKAGYFNLPPAELAAQKKLLADTVAGKF